MAQAGTPDAKKFGDGIPEGIAATEAANSSVSGANLILVLSLGIPAIPPPFLLLATDGIGIQSWPFGVQDHNGRDQPGTRHRVWTHGDVIANGLNC